MTLLYFNSSTANNIINHVKMRVGMREEGEFLLVPFSKLCGTCLLVRICIHPNWYPFILIAANLQLHYCD